MNFSPSPTCVWNVPMSQRQCAAVDEAIFIRERSPVRQQLVAPVAGLIPGESRQAQREEERLSPVRKEFQVIAALRRELFHRNAHILIVVLLVQVFPANHPAVGVLGIDAVRRPDVVGEIRVIVPMHPVRHARRYLQAPHARQVSLRPCLVEMQAQRKECHYKDKFLHAHFILSSSISLAFTMSAFSTRMLWWRPPFFS